MKLKQTRTINVKWIPGTKYAVVDAKYSRVIAVCRDKEDAQLILDMRNKLFYTPALAAHQTRFEILEAIEE